MKKILAALLFTTITTLGYAEDTFSLQIGLGSGVMPMTNPVNYVYDSSDSENVWDLGNVQNQYTISNEFGGSVNWGTTITGVVLNASIVNGPGYWYEQIQPGQYPGQSFNVIIHDPDIGTPTVNGFDLSQDSNGVYNAQVVYSCQQTNDIYPTFTADFYSNGQHIGQIVGALDGNGGAWCGYQVGAAAPKDSNKKHTTATTAANTIGKQSLNQPIATAKAGIMPW